MFWLLVEQNSEVNKAIQGYKDKYVKTKECTGQQGNSLAQKSNAFKLKLHNVLKTKSRTSSQHVAGVLS